MLIRIMPAACFPVKRKPVLKPTWAEESAKIIGLEFLLASTGATLDSQELANSSAGAQGFDLSVFW
jgi:hypothetical protein